MNCFKHSQLISRMEEAGIGSSTNQANHGKCNSEASIKEGEEIGRFLFRGEFSFDRIEAEKKEPEVQGGKVKLIHKILKTRTGYTSYKQSHMHPGRAKLEANAELSSKSMLGSELQGEDFAKKMVDLVNQRKKFFAEERAKAKRNKPMTQSQLKTYMMNYLKNQGSWKLNQLRKLSFEEVKEEFDKLIKQIDSFAPISFEATKDSLKRFGEELQTKTPKRLKEDKDDEAKDDEPTKKLTKRRKQIARKGMHTSVDENVSDDSDKVDEQEETNTGTETPLNPVPVAMKTPSVATYKIIKQGEKGVYQIVREDGTDIVYINFGAMLKSISRDDLIELYRIVMNRYGLDGPEDKLEKGFWKCLRIMFEEPLSTDSIWSEIEQQKIKEKVIAYNPRQLEVPEKNYATPDLEIGEIVFSFKIWERYLDSIPPWKSKRSSRTERAKPLRVRALVMTINSNLPPQIHKTQVESLKTENVKDENLHGIDNEFENRLDGTLYIRRRSQLPRVRDLGKLIKHEPHKPNYFIHPGIE
ncbi:hypothetical protein Tco_1153587 [Tanacetum coccineum]